MTLSSLNISKEWTLFLDRDGVINHRLVDDYVKSWEDFKFIDGVPEAIKILDSVFGKIIVVTNQQGVGKGLMKMETLQEIHRKMMSEIKNAGGRIDKIYFCPDLKESKSFDRKPQVGMGLKAKNDFPYINFKKSIMAGDSLSDMKFGRRLQMTTVWISSDLTLPRNYPKPVDYTFDDLKAFSQQFKFPS
jgi:histidinol-phosphate phosphatase family protein